MSKIEWCDETWNPVVGCSRISAGCKNCYAATQAASGRLQQFTQYQKVKEWDGTIQLVPSQFDKPFKWKSTKRIFTCSMGDLSYEYRAPGLDKGRDKKFGNIKNFPLYLQVREFPA
ncbi:DUF5131 family protein [Anabaena sp. PCC 7108]|uniref:DUF5131 family protein n=1 Tax=Anabaena sp. PCC 7108 TaxID=163908 RepID=UPI00035F2B52|nr:DUF5131 family protein [Anabaena sp. PCC 7108]